MAIGSPKSDAQKITVTLPRSLLARLDEYVAPRQRGRFIAEAIEERLALEEQLAAIEEAAGAWTDENHPEMQTAEDIDRWLAELRSSWSRQDEANNGQVPD